MIFSDVYWISSNTKKMDRVLQKELLNCYKPTRFMPNIVQNVINKFRYNFKKIDVIVRLNHNYYPNDEKTVRELIRLSRWKKSVNIDTLNCYSAKISPNHINKLLQIKSVKCLYLDAEVKALLNTANASAKIPFAWKMDCTGKGVTTAVMDTGIYPHKDLTTPFNRIIAFKDFINNKSLPYDDNGHGTHVAGAIAGNGIGSKGLYKGPAYDSFLVGVKVLDRYGSGRLSNVLAGLEWCIQNKQNFRIRILCLSLGTKADNSYKNDLLCEAVEKAWNAGIVVCAAAGNDGPDPHTISTPGIHPRIITVGATDDKNTENRSDDTVADFSSRGPTIDHFAKPDIVSPGTHVISLRAPNSYLDNQLKSARVEKGYFMLSGTSMSTPICCGLIAVMLENNSMLQPDQVKEIITKSAWNMGMDQNSQGAGHIDAQAALSQISSVTKMPSCI